MKSFAALCFAIVFISSGFCNQSNDNPYEKYSLVKIKIKDHSDIRILQKKDIDIEHFNGNLKEGIILVLNQADVIKLKTSGLNYEILSGDLKEEYSKRGKTTKPELELSKSILRENNIEGFSYGSMGGYYTYNEVVQKLDSMRIQFPNLISLKRNLGSTSEGRIIWAVKISDNPDANESAAEAPVYFDALHHAREPQSMACMMYFMYWLLENYSVNPEASYLINNREIFFIPVVNPDGYVYNQSTNPNGGGLWRKNRRNNGGNCYGVDLNRNYSYGWGLDIGSSNDPCSDIYRGPSASSEPETQAITAFLNQIRPKISFTMHSYAGRYLNPYGFTDTVVSYNVYSEYASDIGASNNYLYGTVFEMLEYYTSGTTRDYLHSLGSYAWTPEVGGTDFWPPQSQIIPVANENLYGMKYLSWVSGAFADYLNYKILGNGFVQRDDTLKLQVAVKNRGLSMTSKNVSVNVASLSPDAQPINASVQFDSIQVNQVKNNFSNPVMYKISPSALFMNEMKFIITVSQEGVITSKDTISIFTAKSSVLFFDNSESGTSHWTKSGTGTMWDSTFADPHDGNKNFSDSRFGNSKNTSNNYFALIDTIDLTGTSNPRIEFSAKWAQESGVDYARIQLSTNFGSSWINLSGKFTTTVSGQPSYTGIRHWKNEQINLNSYIGRKIKIRFNLFTDGFIPGDGFYFDNFRVVNYFDAPVQISSTNSSAPENFSLKQNFPNPFNPETKIIFEIPSLNYASMKVNLVVYDIYGKEVKTLINESNSSGFQTGVYSVAFRGDDLASGTYYYRLDVTGGAGKNIFSKVMKMILLK